MAILITNVGRAAAARAFGVCVALACARFVLAAGPPGDLDLQVVAEGFSQPIGVTGAGDGSGRLFVVEQAGVVKIVGVGTFLDISARVDSSTNEQGLLGLAFHPDFSNNGYFFVNYTHDPGPGLDVTRISRFKVSATDPDAADPDSEVVVLSFAQDDDNHNGGGIAFGPDGYLYIATGDGGGSFDPGDRGQSLDTLLGKILRIDVDSMGAYEIPFGNPFEPVAGARDEIWAYGLRNPWRISFDRSTGDLYIGDVGQGQIEEVDFQPASSGGGENYGWSCKEGYQSPNYNPCDGAPLTDPILVYDHSLGCSVTGGFVYRGDIPGLHGRYVFGDYCSGRIWFAENNDGWSASQWATVGFGLSSFGEDDDGELYLTDRDDGKLLKFVSPSSVFTDPFESGNVSRWSSSVGDAP
jgi:glucose/arabinose dehydrogenase